jgi:hypothetical protein
MRVAGVVVVSVVDMVDDSFLLRGFGVWQTRDGLRGGRVEHCALIYMGEFVALPDRANVGRFEEET